jgi:beta-glucanase (GH16 family)
VRLTSKNSYTHGLVILDLAHMPGGVCGTWPAFWMVGPNWPNSGEIDIIEGVNSQGKIDKIAGTTQTNTRQVQTR